MIGGGPAGLMAAEALAAAGLRVLLAEAKPTLGRKLLMAGKSGLNLSKDLATADFAAGFTGGAAGWRRSSQTSARRTSAPGRRASGSPVFTGSSGRMFPQTMKASPLLRAWTRRLEAARVALRTRWRWPGWRTAPPASPRRTASAPSWRGDTVLALGGGSWARLGSDGAWTAILAGRGRADRAVPPVERRLSRRLVAGDGPALRRAGQAGAAHAPAAAAVRPSSSSRPAASRAAGSTRSRDLLRDGAPLVLDLVPGRSEADDRGAPGAAARRRLARRTTCARRWPLAGKDRAAARMRAGGARDPAATAAALKRFRCRSPGRARSTRRSRPRRRRARRGSTPS